HLADLLVFLDRALHDVVDLRRPLRVQVQRSRTEDDVVALYIDVDERGSLVRPRFGHLVGLGTVEKALYRPALENRRRRSFDSQRVAAAIGGATPGDQPRIERILSQPYALSRLLLIE